MATCLPKQQTGTKLTKSQKEEHKIWVNLNNFRKQYFMGKMKQEGRDEARSEAIRIKLDAILSEC